jgi:alcohol dehydrogenase class IV
MIAPFVSTSLPSRVVFGRGALQRVGEEMDRLGCKRVLVIASGSQAPAGQAAAEALGARYAGTFDGAALHPGILRTL